MSRHRIRRGWLVSSLLLAAGTLIAVPRFTHATDADARASRVVSLIEQSGSIPLGKHLDYIEDPAAALSLNDILASEKPGAGPIWTPSKRDVLNCGYTLSAFWVRFSVRNPYETPAEWSLEIDYPHLDLIQLFEPVGSGRFAVRRAGDRLPFVERELYYRNFVFQLRLPAHETRVYYLRVATTGSMEIALRAWPSPQRLVQKITNENFLLGIYYGFIIVMILYNLFIFVSTRDRNYLYYVVYIAAYGIYQMIGNGLAFQYLWPDSIWWANQCYPFFIYLMIVTGFQFSRTFLRMQSILPRLNRFILALMGFYVLCLAASFTVPYSIMIRLAVGSGMFAASLMLAIGVVFLLRGYRAARFYLLAWAAFLAGSLVLTLKLVGAVDLGFISEWGQQIGSAMEMVLLSFALADRINILKKEKEDAQAEALASLRTSDRLKDEFLSNISHELNTPIASLVMSAEMLAAGDFGGTELPGIYEQMRRDASRLNTLVENLMITAMLESRELKARLENAEIGGVAREVAERFRREYLMTRLETVIPGAPVRAMTDPALLTKLLRELLDNALRYGAPERGITIALERDARDIRLAISDRGPGIPPEHLDRVRGKFYRVDSSLTYREPGTGLGLYLAAGIARALGGSLDLSNRPGGGLVARLTIPLSDVGAAGSGGAR